MTTTPQQLPQAWLDVQAERRRQVEVENWSTEHDDQHPAGELAAAGSAYALYASDELCPTSRGRVDYGSLAPFMWPFNIAWWKRSAPRRALVKAAALILAEIERLDRAGGRQPEGCCKALAGWTCSRNAEHEGPCAAEPAAGESDA